MKSNYKEVDLYTYIDGYSGKEMFRGMGKKATSYGPDLLRILQHGMWWGWKQNYTDAHLRGGAYTFQLPGEFLS